MHTDPLLEHLSAVLWGRVQMKLQEPLKTTLQDSRESTEVDEKTALCLDTNALLHIAAMTDKISDIADFINNHQGTIIVPQQALIETWNNLDKIGANAIQRLEED